MRKYWILAVLLLTSCAPVTAKSIYPQTTSIPPPTPQILPTLPPIQPTPAKTSITPVFAPVAEVVAPEWVVLAQEMRGKAQQALDTDHWEDIQFKEDAYAISNKMIRISTGKVKETSTEVLKRFRWGIELMNEGQLREVIRILDQYN